MMSYNKNFTFSIGDIALIEDSLRTRMSKLNDDIANQEEIDCINQLLAKIHHQKTWYKPKDTTYISG